MALKIASADNVVKLAVSRRIPSLEHRMQAVKSNSDAVKQASKTMRRLHGSN